MRRIQQRRTCSYVARRCRTRHLSEKFSSTTTLSLLQRHIPGHFRDYCSFPVARRRQTNLHIVQHPIQIIPRPAGRSDDDLQGQGLLRVQGQLLRTAAKIFFVDLDDDPTNGKLYELVVGAFVTGGQDVDQPGFEGLEIIGSEF
jgi:hypothetical protein